MLDTKELTVDDIINAIEQNGIPKYKGEFIKYENGVDIIAGCAFGQAAINLGINEREMWYALRDVAPGFADTVVRMNDNTEATLQEIAKLARTRYREAYRSKRLTVKKKIWRVIKEKE